ncbi:MAG: hypothetical protein LRY71_03050 [Bacillaceae bacterium]|nr:hypothetical protein [Bacillaceae bacterium]
MLMAITKDGESVSLQTQNKEYILTLLKGQTFYCPVCKGEVIAKLGDKQIWHFAHRKLLKCDALFEPETPHHLKGKRQLFQCLRKNINVQLEKYLPDIKQRPDLLLLTGKHKIGVEYQCSPIPMQLFNKRTNNYINHGYKPIWILGSNLFKRKSKNFIYLNQFLWLFARRSCPNARPYFLFYCPLLESFITVTNVIPISSLNSIGNIQITPLNDATFPFSFSPTHEINLNLWNKIKRNWRTPKRHQSNSVKFLYNFYYHKQKNPLLFPSEAGIPIKNHESIETPLYVWQAWLLETHLSTRKKGDRIPLQLFFRSFETMVKQRIFHLRTLPLIQNCTYKSAIENYLCFLAAIGILSRVNSQMFVKVKEVRELPLFEHALKQDEMIQKKYFDFSNKY